MEDHQGSLMLLLKGEQWQTASECQSAIVFNGFVEKLYLYFVLILTALSPDCWQRDGIEIKLNQSIKYLLLRPVNLMKSLKVGLMAKRYKI